jgi:hypothetical protein
MVIEHIYNSLKEDHQVTLHETCCINSIYIELLVQFIYIYYITHPKAFESFTSSSSVAKDSQVNPVSSLYYKPCESFNSILFALLNLWIVEMMVMVLGETCWDNEGGGFTRWFHKLR